MVVQPSTVKVTELGAQECRDALFLRYGLEPLDLPHCYDGCNATFSIFHAFNYKQGGLVMAHQNELRGRFADLSGKAFTPTHVHADPLIFVGCAVKRPKAKPARSKSTKATSATPPL